MSVRLNDILFPNPVIRNFADGRVVASSVPLDFIDEDPDPNTVNEAAFICTIPKSGDLNGLIIGLGDVADGVEVTARIETVDPATGDPTGTLLDAGLTVSEVVGEQSSPYTWDAAFAAPIAVVAGTVVAIRLSCDGIDTDALLFTGLQRAFPYVRIFDGTTWTQVEGIIPVAFSYEAVAGERSIVNSPGGLPIKTVQDLGQVVGSLPAGSRVGFFFTPEFIMTVSGVWFIGKLAADAAIQITLNEAIEIDAPVFDLSEDYLLTLKALQAKRIFETEIAQAAGDDARGLIQAMFTTSQRLLPTKTYFLEISGSLSGLNMNAYTDFKANDEVQDDLSLPASWLSKIFLFVNGSGAMTQIGIKIDFGLIVRAGSIRPAVGGGVPPGVIGDFTLLKAEQLKEFIDVDDAPLKRE